MTLEHEIENLLLPYIKIYIQQITWILKWLFLEAALHSRLDSNNDTINKDCVPVYATILFIHYNPHNQL